MSEPIILGTDVSSAQGPNVIYASYAREKLRFNIPKCTTGATGIDAWFARNVDASEEAGVDVPFAYHWLSWQTAVIAQVANYLAHGGERVENRRCMIDFEDEGFGKLDPRVSVSMAEEFSHRIADATGKAASMYTGRWFAPWVAGMDSEVLAALDLIHAAYPLFGRTQFTGRDRAHYEAFVAALPHEDRLDIAGPWKRRNKRPIIHQIDGNAGLVLPQGIDADFDLWLGDEASYQAFILAATGKPCAFPMPLPPKSDPPITQPQTPTSKSSQRLKAVDAPIFDDGPKTPRGES